MNQAVSENDRITNLHLGFCNEPKYRPVNDKLQVVGLGKSAYESPRRFSDHTRRQHREKSGSFFVSSTTQVFRAVVRSKPQR